MTSLTKKPQTQNLIFFYCKLQTSRVFRGFEQLSSSTCWRVLAGQSWLWENKSNVLCNFFIFCRKLGFRAIVLTPVILEIQSRPLGTQILAQFPKKLESKNSPFGCRPRPCKLGQKCENTRTCDVTHRELQTQNWKTFFSIETRRLPKSVEGFTAL